jgi:AGCS family alanine or glycine:cation symporter
MSVRFAEVYISALYGMRSRSNSALGGPMLYLKDVAGGKYLPWVYAVFCLTFGLLGGNAFQANSIQVSLTTTWGISPVVSGVLLFIFVLYILLGGAERIVKISLTIVPVKVLVFVVSACAVLVYHAAALPDAFYLIVSSALGMKAFAGGIIGFTLQQVIRAGMTSAIFATESGLGSAAILFGSTGSTDPIQSGLMGMISTFLSAFAGFIVALCIVVSGVWNSGLNSTALTIASFETVFGSAGGWIVSFLSVSFGFGVLVSYAYIARTVWLFLTSNRYEGLFVAVYSLCTLAGALATVVLVWDLINIAVAATLLINLFGILYLLPVIRPELMNNLKNYKA